jgi:hypothetical protein
MLDAMKHEDQMRRPGQWNHVGSKESLDRKAIEGLPSLNKAG